MFNVLSF